MKDDNIHERIRHTNMDIPEEKSKCCGAGKLGLKKAYGLSKRGDYVCALCLKPFTPADDELVSECEHLDNIDFERCLKCGADMSIDTKSLFISQPQTPKEEQASEEKCKCACHLHPIKQPAQHDLECCPEINGCKWFIPQSTEFTEDKFFVSHGDVTHGSDECETCEDCMKCSERFEDGE